MNPSLDSKPTLTNPVEVRANLAEALKLDFAGPWPEHPFANELLPANPTRWYLTGYLVPEHAPVQHRSDAEAKEEVDAGGEGGGMDDGGTPDKAATPSLLPSSMGLIVLVPTGVAKLQAEVTWGDYLCEDPTKEAEEPSDEGLGLKEEIKPESYEAPESSAAALAGIQRLRELHAGMDAAVLTAYGWTDLLPKCACEFLLDYEDDESESGAEAATGRQKKKPWRYRWPDELRDEVLARLLKLNAERAEQERIAGIAAEANTPVKKKNAGGKKPAAISTHADLIPPPQTELF